MEAKLTKPFILKNAVTSIAIPQRLKELQSIFGYFKGILACDEDKFLKINHLEIQIKQLCLS